MAEYSADRIKDLLKGLDIHIVPYCHADYAWTHPRSWHADRYVRIVDEVLDIMEENPGYTWMADNMLHIIEPYLAAKGQDASVLVQRIMEGRLEVTNGSLVLLRPTMTGGETFIRNIALGRKFLEELGLTKDIHVFHNVDVSIGHTQMPQLLKLSGFKYYRCWRPQGAMDAKGLPREFVWTGLDGTVLLCSRGTYAGLWKAGYLRKKAYNDSDGTLAEFYVNEIEDILSHNTTGILWLPFGMDDTRPMTDFRGNYLNFDDFMEYLGNATGARIRYSTAENYFDRLASFNLPDYAGIPDPCDVSYNIPTKGDKGLWRYRILLDAMIVRAEVLCTMAYETSGSYPGAELAEAWNNLILICGHAMEFIFHDDYEEILELAANTVTEVRKLINSAVSEIIGAADAGTGTYAAVNTLNWNRKEIVRLPVRSNISSTSDTAPGFPAKSSVSQQSCDGGMLFEIEIPAMGTCFIEDGGIVPEKAPDESLADNVRTLQTVDNGAMILGFRNGMICFKGNIFPDMPNNQAFGKLCFTEIEQPATDAWLYNDIHGKTYSFTAEEWHWEETGPLRWIYAVSGTIGSHRAYIKIILRKNKPLIDYDIAIHCKEKSSGVFHTVFPAGGNSVFTAGIPFGYEERKIAKEPYGILTEIDIDNLERRWPGLFYAADWLNYKIRDTHVSVIGTKAPRYYWYDEAADTVSLILTRTFDLDKCTDWMKDTHSYNECLGTTNFRYSVYLSPDTRVNHILKTIRHSMEAAHPIEAGMSIYPRPPACISLGPRFKIESDSCILSSLFREAEKTVLRIYNASPKPDNLTVNTGLDHESCFSSDFMLNPLERRHQLIVKGKSISTLVDPWEIVTIVFIQSG